MSKMYSLAIKPKMYDNPTSASVEENRFPSVYLPLSMVKDMDLQPGDKVTLEFEGEVKMLTNEYNEEVAFKLIKGCVEPTSAKEKKEEPKK